ncbi:hypothetical protein FOA43_001232 [Brettanomyces nanus]|uniref:GTPase-activating protein GYP5 n=1 Tax=Eeniella nana TaxID=13502 RepID=A0A875RTW3_EENNA|nr:uncharacterized protein FOA43_001232 [Brettanomyces nanus]QPG73917.1 hypothetical protein FOA43_001232 [Brettanomyces nanus]
MTENDQLEPENKDLKAKESESSAVQPEAETSAEDIVEKALTEEMSKDDASTAHKSFKKMTDDELKVESETPEMEQKRREAGQLAATSVSAKTEVSAETEAVDEKEAEEEEEEEAAEKTVGSVGMAQTVGHTESTESTANSVDSQSQQTETSAKSMSTSSFKSTKSSTSLEGLRKWFTFGKNGNEVTTKETMRYLKKAENFNLALSRFRENKEALLLQPERDQEAVNTCANNLRKTFNEIKTGIEISHDELLIEGIDWEFWSAVVNDYSVVVREKPKELLDNISRGIPKELRGMVWQLICNSKSLLLEEFYRTGKTRNSSYEKLIKRDLARTSFVTNSEVRTKIDDLFDVIKCYSLYDKEVGYTQGMAFITVPLLMNMDASEVFCMLVKLMNNYGFRELYLPEMPGLHLKLYQFDRLLEDQLPDLYLHLQKQGVKSSMYATQWFLTLFGYKFPLDMVLRIYDIVIAEGIESILRFALNLMQKNHERLLTLRFDQLLEFLKEQIFFHYLTADSGEISLETYRLDDFVSDSMNVNILPLMLNRYEAEFNEIQRLERERKQEVEGLRNQNSELLKDIRQIEAAYATLNKGHVGIANEMVKGKVGIANLREENQQLKEKISETTTRLAKLSTQTDLHVDFSGEISNTLDLEIQKTMERNFEVMEENAQLEETLASLDKERESLRKEIHRKSKWSLPKKRLW